MPEIEIGTVSNPIVFTGVIAGEEFLHPNNPFYLWNDKGSINGSVDARELTIKVLGLNLVDELVGTSNGTASQSFTVAFPPVIANDSENPLIVKVNGVIWTLVADLLTAGNTDEVYEFDYNTGIVSFGDNINGKIPPTGNLVEISYTPDTVEFGTEISEFNWLGIQSTGIISNPRLVGNEREIAIDTTHVAVAHTPIVSITGVFLNSDPGHFGTNYFTGGTFNAMTGIITLGTALPSSNETVLIEYQYTIKDDVEPGFTQIGKETSHTFLNPIPSNNAKLIYLRLTPPATTSPSGFMNLQFRLRVDYKA